MMKNNPLKKQSTTPADAKTQNHFVEERDVYPLLVKSAAVPTTQGQRYAKN